MAQTQLPEIKLEVFLFPSFNPALTAVIDPFAPLNDVKELHLTCLKGTSGKEKLENIIAQYSNYPANSLYPHPHGVNFVAKVQKLSSHIGPLMLSTSRKEWFNKFYIITLKIKKYNYLADDGSGSKKNIKGLTFLLEAIDLKN